MAAPTVIGSSKVLTADNTKLTKKVKEVMPFLAKPEDVANVFGEGEYSVSTKRDFEKAVEKVKENLQKTLGIQVAEKAIRTLLETVGDSSIQLDIVRATLADFEPMLCELSSKIEPKIRYAIATQDLIQVRVTFADNPIRACLMLVQIDEETLWLPVTLDVDEDEDISKDDCSKINSFLRTVLFEKYPNNYSGVVTGPRGGTLEIGRVFTTQIQEEGQKVRKEMGDCVIEY